MMTRFLLFTRCVARNKLFNINPSQISYLRKLAENIWCIYQEGLLCELIPPKRGAENVLFEALQGSLRVAEPGLHSRIKPTDTMGLKLV